MFEKEIDEIYELCKRVVNEVPTASVTFVFSGYGLDVREKRTLDFLKAYLSGTYIGMYPLILFLKKRVAKASK